MTKKELTKKLKTYNGSGRRRGAMKIPDTTKKDRYYVATSLKKAFSSWDTLEEARDCVDRFYTHDPESFFDIVCIVRTNKDGKEIFRHEG